MPRYKPVVFAAGSSRHDSEAQSTTERLVNLFPEQGPSESRPVMLRSCPGFTETISQVGSPVRAMLPTEDKIFTSRGGKLYSFDGTTVTELGKVPDDIQTTLAWNGTELALVAGGLYYLWDGTTLTNVAGQAFTSFGSVSYQSGYFLFTEKDGGKHAISALYDGASLNALDFASAEYQPDNIVRGFVDHDEYWLFGSRTVEVWVNTGNADYPFERVPGGQLERGCLATNTVAKMDNTVFWVGNDRVVYRAIEYRPQRVSDHRVEAALRDATGLSAFIYEHEGHKFYVLRMDGRPSWVYDVATQAWHERASGQALDPWQVTAAAQMGTEWYFGTDDGALCKLGRVWQERGAVLRRMAQSRVLTLGGKRFRVPSAFIRCSGDGGTLMMQTSEDAANWTREQFRSIGATGQYSSREVEFHRLGQGRQFAMRLSFSDNADFGIHDAGVRVA